MRTFARDKMERFCQDAERCITGSAPTLNTLAEAYGGDSPSTWLVPYINDLCAFCSAKSKLTTGQYVQLAQMIYRTYGFLKVSELMLFFYRLKQGRYLRFYGAVDPLAIMEALRHFTADRNEIIEIADRKRAFNEWQEHKKRAITYEEYQRRKSKDGKT